MGTFISRIAESARARQAGPLPAAALGSSLTESGWQLGVADSGTCQAGSLDVAIGAARPTVLIIMASLSNRTAGAADKTTKDSRASR